MGQLTTHILDTVKGLPAANVSITLFGLQHTRVQIVQLYTNSSGRCARALLEDSAMCSGQYELVFDMGDYFRRQNYPLSDPPFIDRIVLSFGIADVKQHYHIPLLVSPWSYSTYRGS